MIEILGWSLGLPGGLLGNLTISIPESDAYPLQSGTLLNIELHMGTVRYFLSLCHCNVSKPIAVQGHVIGQRLAVEQ